MYGYIGLRVDVTVRRCGWGGGGVYILSRNVRDVDSTLYYVWGGVGIVGLELD